MVSSIGSSAISSMMQRPDPSQMASKLFSKLDTRNQGYIEKSDLQSAFDQLSGSGSTSGTTGVDEVFAQLDGNGDGKVTKQEMSDSLQNLASQLDSQFDGMRAKGMGGMPPPPPPGESDNGGFTKDELSSMAEQIGSTETRRSELITKLVANFDKADTDGDGKVSHQEAMAFDQSSRNASSTDSGTTASSSSTGSTEAKVMMKIMQLMHAYGGFGQDGSQSSSSGTLSVSA